MRRRLVSATPVARVVSLGLATMLLVACGESGVGSSATPLPPIAVPTEVTVEGRAVPAKTAELASSMAGMVLSVPVEEGDAVTAGAVLVQLDPAAAQVELDAASAAVDAAAAGLAQAKAAVDQAEAGVDQAEASLRAARAAEDQLPDGASSAAKREAAAQVDAAEAALTGARAQAESAAAAAEAAAAEQRRAESARAGAQLVVDRHAITAPFAGRVSSVGVQPGELVGAGQVLARLADTSGWTFETDDADEAVIGQIEPGARATVSLDGLPGVTIPGTVSRVGTYGTELQGDVRYTVVVTPDGDVPDGVRWNMTATMEIAAGD